MDRFCFFGNVLSVCLNKISCLSIACLTVLLVACQKEEILEKEVNLGKVLIIGNSITYHPPDLSIGWDADWGMAASLPELDFVSVLTDSIRTRNPAAEVIKENVYPFERHFDELDLDTYSYLRDFEADLLIIRLGENVNMEKLEGDNFKEALKNFVVYLSGGRKIDVVITTTFWENIPVTEQLVKAGEELDWNVVPMSFLGQDGQYMALGKFENEAVARHPNDLGMKKIANLIWEAILKQ